MESANRMQDQLPRPPDPPLSGVGVLLELAKLHPLLLACDAAERVVWASDALGDLLGSSPVGSSLRELLRGDCLVRADGGEVPVHASVIALQSERCAASLVVVCPEQERLRRDRGLAPHEAPFRAILDSSPEPVLAVDRQGFVTYANPALADVLGCPLESLGGQPLAALFAEPKALCEIAAVLDPGSGGGTREIGLASGGRRLSVSTSPLRLADGTRAGTVAFLRDVTEARRFEQKLARKNAELEHYVHTVSHDLRTPLVSLLGFSRLLAQDYGDVLSDTGRHFLERIEQASRNMEDLINDLLELSRIGEPNGQRGWVDPLAVLKQITADLKPRLEERGVSLELPESPPAIFCVRTQLYQVAANLIGNALEHMGEPRSPSVRIFVREELDALVLGVEDNGTGIAPEHHDRIFEIFQTAGRRAGRKGTGIGLAIVKKIAESHGGRVWVESRPGEGARFQVAFPRD